MAKTYEELLEQAAIVRDETAAGKNTAARVGGALADAVDYVKGLEDFYADIHKQAEDANTAAAAAKTTAAEAKTNSTTALNNSKSAVLTANAAQAAANTAQSTAEAAKSELNDKISEEVGLLNEEDNRLAGLIAENKTKIASVEDIAIKGRDTASSVSEKAAELETRILNVSRRTAFISELGSYSSLDELLAAAATFEVASDAGVGLIHGTVMVGTTQSSSVLIMQQVTKNADGSGTTMQYISAGKYRYSRYINFTATDIDTGKDSVQPAQFDVPRNLVHSGSLLKMTDMYGNNVGSSVTI